MAGCYEESMTMTYEPAQPHSPLRHVHGGDAYFTPDCVFPPNGPLYPLDDHPHYRLNHGLAYLDQRPHWQQFQHYSPYPSTYVHGNRTYTMDSSDLSSADSISARPSEEPVFDPSYSRITNMSPYPQGQMYLSPSPTHASVGPECGSVIPQDVQQLPDPIAETVDHLDMEDTIEVHSVPAPAYTASPPMMETGLPTPTSEDAPGILGAPAGFTCGEETDAEDNSGDYSPITRKSKTRKTKQAPKTAAPRSPLKRHSKGHKVTKSSSKINGASSLASPPHSAKELSPTQCTTCGQEQRDKNALARHVQANHTRPFTCIFDIYGCTATFGAKNEWKRHCSTQHLRLSFYRCDMGSCVPQNATTSQRLPGWDMPVASPSTPGFNDFNRKDLFIQHHRRMHAPEGIANATPQEKDRFKTICERAARRCQVSARRPPPKTFCGFCEAKGCPAIFEGNSAWETRMEHVGRHLEAAKSENMKWAEDIDLRNWLVSEGLLKQIGREKFRLTDLIKAEEVKAGKR